MKPARKLQSDIDKNPTILSKNSRALEVSTNIWSMMSVLSEYFPTDSSCGKLFASENLETCSNLHVQIYKRKPKLFDNAWFNW